jgi:peptidoglycan hydrolase-like protein with peptidoglycan-binding domain
VSRIIAIAIAALLISLCGSAHADEAIRLAQEELRKRNLFYGDIDGRETPGFLEALKRYQQRKGFAPTGVVDVDTLRSMGLSAPEVSELPNVPVLRSDRRAPPQVWPLAAGASVQSPPAPATPLRSDPAPSQEEMRRFIRAYLDACQSPDVADELGFYADRVDYFHHGNVDQNYIRGLLHAYYEQWPERSYRVGDTIRLGKSGEYTTARNRINFTLKTSGGRTASGRTDNTFTVARRPDNSLVIIGHQEERVRQNARRRSSKSRSDQQRITPLDRTLRKIFGPSKKRKR